MNLVLVAVVYVALAFGAMTGLLAGAAGGLVQDALAGGIVGIGGISKTIVGFAVGVLGAQFIVSQPMPRLVMFVLGTVLHELCFQGMYALIEGRVLQFPWAHDAHPGRDQRPGRGAGLSDRGRRARSEAAPRGAQGQLRTAKVLKKALGSRL